MFKIIHGDICELSIDAIVNAANETLLGGGGVDGAIHRAAGPELLEECRTLNGCQPGQAKITKGYQLPAKYVIHTVGPRYKDGKQGEAEILRSCYREAIKLAKDKGLSSLAFPLISSGAFAYPYDLALQIAEKTIKESIHGENLEVYLVLFP